MQPIFIDFREPNNLYELSKYIGISEEKLNVILDRPNRLRLFIKHKIPKKGKSTYGAYRIVWQAHPFVADEYKAFARRFENFSRETMDNYPHPAAFGYIKKRGTLENATPHCRAKFILHADVENFFSSISSEMITQLFLRMKIKESVADILSNFCTIEKALPLGLHPSPLLANLVCLQLDEDFKSLAEKYECKYTRYADDITISGQSSVPDKREVEAILAAHKFVLAKRKFRITKIGQAHYVTGLSVSDSKPRVPRSYKRKLRQELHYIRKYGVVNHFDYLGFKGLGRQGAVNMLDGMLRYVSHIEPAHFKPLRSEWNKLLQKEGLGVNYRSIENKTPESIRCYIDECEFLYRDKKYLALGFAFMRLEDTFYMNGINLEVLKGHVFNPFSDGRKDELMKKGLHFTDCTEDLRKEYSDYLAIAPIKGYIAYSSLKKQDYEGRYIYLLGRILPHRLMAYDGMKVELIFEENSKVKSNLINQLVNTEHQKLKHTNNRNPSEIKVVIGSKREFLCFSIPDFLLGFFHNYLANTKKDRSKNLFEKLRDKYRIILDVDNNQYFTRTRPFCGMD